MVIVGVDDFDIDELSGFLVDIDFARLLDEMIEALEGDLENIVFRIVDDAVKRQPGGLDLVA